MNWQLLTVLAIIALAAVFVGKSFLFKARSFSPKNSCASDCGCDAEQKAK